MAKPRTISRVASRIQERVAYCLQFEVRDPRASFVTITRVEMSADLRHAKVHYSTLETGGGRSRIQHMLEDATGFIRTKIARVLETREVPGLRWVFDESIGRASEMDALIRRARESDEAIRGTPAPAEGDPVAAAELDDSDEFVEFDEFNEPDEDSDPV